MFSFVFFLQALTLGLALAMDCFTVSITCGLQKTLTTFRKFVLAFSFAFFQAFMTFLGSLLASFFYDFIVDISAWISFTLLFIIGIKMIMEGRKFSLRNKVFDVTSLKVILLLSIATSIDAMIVGMSFAGMEWVVGEQLISILMIFLVTFILSLIGERMGEKIRFIKPRFALFLGGAILIIIGLKTILQHYL
ncbi:MAG: manganese efflux pump [Bacteroidota bacterium]|nr:manganese efflux pump [Bacteroidota bacterium]